MIDPRVLAWLVEHVGFKIRLSDVHHAQQEKPGQWLLVWDTDVEEGAWVVIPWNQPRKPTIEEALRAVSEAPF